jgi:hypothetical protein
VPAVRVGRVDRPVPVRLAGLHDDARRGRRAQALVEQAREGEGADRVRAEHELEAVLGLAPRRRHEAGVEHEAGHAARRVDGGGERPDRPQRREVERRVGDVRAGRGGVDRGDGPVAARGVAGAEEDGVAGPGEPGGEGHAEPGGGAGHDGERAIGGQHVRGHHIGDGYRGGPGDARGL